jgi:hypothetical protein
MKFHGGTGIINLSFYSKIATEVLVLKREYSDKFENYLNVTTCSFIIEIFHIVKWNLFSGSVNCPQMRMTGIHEINSSGEPNKVEPPAWGLSGFSPQNETFFLHFTRCLTSDGYITSLLTGNILWACIMDSAGSEYEPLTVFWTPGSTVSGCTTAKRVST